MSTADQVTDVPRWPVTSAGERIGVNGALAAALTRVVGSMPALYVVLALVVGWMGLATWGPLRQVDPYPFPFLLFLDNVVQLVLCLVILVGQRVLGAAADRRAVQTYEHAETIFARVADLQAHLDRQDRVLSRGVSLLESSPHPWIHRHHVQAPPQAIDQAIGANGRVAAWLTQRLGSMWAFYLAAGTQVMWIGLALAGVQRIDPYPFAFMSFLSTLAQLIFMIVIMVGQDVLGRAADRRSEQTFVDAEAILHECGRMEARLAAQDRIINSLADYAAGQVTEHLARALHESYLRAGAEDGDTQIAAGALVEWDKLAEPLKEASRAQARRVGERLAAIGCLMVPSLDATAAVSFTDAEADLLARLEHERWLTEQGVPPASGDPGADGDRRPDLAPWEQLPERTRERNIQAARRIPALLAGVGFVVMRDGAVGQDGSGEADFSSGEWATLGQSLMSAGVLVSLAEGVADAEELFALVRKLRETSIDHPRRFIRELTAATTFDTGLRAGAGYEEYAGPALTTIRTATAIVAGKAPAELPAFRTLLVEIAATVADANNEGGFFGLGARPRTPNEAAAMDAVRTATELDPVGADLARS